MKSRAQESKTMTAIDKNRPAWARKEGEVVPKPPPPAPPTPPSPNERSLMPVNSFTTLPNDDRKLTGSAFLPQDVRDKKLKSQKEYQLKLLNERLKSQANNIRSGWAVPSQSIPQSQMPLQPMTQSGQGKRLNPRTGMYEDVQSNRFF